MLVNFFLTEADIWWLWTEISLLNVMGTLIGPNNY